MRGPKPKSLDKVLQGLPLCKVPSACKSLIETYWTSIKRVSSRSIPDCEHDILPICLSNASVTACLLLAGSNVYTILVYHDMAPVRIKNFCRSIRASCCWNTPKCSLHSHSPSSRATCVRSGSEISTKSTSKSLTRAQKLEKSSDERKGLQVFNSSSCSRGVGTLACKKWNLVQISSVPTCTNRDMYDSA